MGKARPFSLFPLDFEKAMRGLLAAPKEAVAHVMPATKSKNKKHKAKKTRR
jgi:hypothetical protein